MDVVPGRLEVIAGCMWSGKTETLITRVAEFGLKSGANIAVFKPVTDTRHPTPEIVSHDGTRLHAKWIERGLPDLPRDVSLIALDEAQFLSLDSVPRIVEVMRAGVHVVMAGLDLTFRGEPFGPMPALMALADTVTKLKSRCAKCHLPASRSQRLTASAETVLVGGAEAYEPRCVVCFDPKG